MFDEFVRFGARTRPYHPAISNGAAHISYRHLDREVDKVGSALWAGGVTGMGSVIGVAARDGYRHALLTLACARLGLGTTSLLPGMAVPMAALAGAEAMLADDPALGAGRDRAGMTVDGDWFQAALTADHEPLPPPPPRDWDAIARVQLSSGTTGMPKAVALTWAEQERRAATALSLHGMAARTLSLIGPESGGFASWTSTWRSLGTVLVGPPDLAQLAQLLPVLAPRTLVASPVQIAALLAALPPDYASVMEPMIVAVAGGRVSRRVREQLAVRMGATVAPAYASTEAGTVAAGLNGQLSHEGDVGYLMPGITVEIVDADDRPLAPGEPGLLRIAGRSVVAGYRDGPGEAFRGGWFYPGDLGSLAPDGCLRILGRADEIINVGGEKFSPETLEDRVRDVAGVADVAAFALDGEDGERPWLAIVRSGEIDEGEIGRALALPGLPTVSIAWIEAIPRTPMGKPRREELKAAARRL